MEWTFYSRLLVPSFVLLVQGIFPCYPHLLGAFLFPHGPPILDPAQIDPKKEIGFRPNYTVAEARKLQEGMRKQASVLASISPDLFIIISPEGIRTKDMFVAHGNIQSRGSAYWNGQWSEFRASTIIDINATSKLDRWMGDHGHPFQTLEIGEETDPNFPLPLSWSESVPLWFIEEAFSSRGSPTPPAIIIVLPSAYEQDPSKFSNLMRFGGDLFRFIHHSLNPRKKVAILTFGDLSHNHLNSSESPYSLNQDASRFDEICTSWGKRDVKGGSAQQHSLSQLSQAALMTKQTFSCGFNGILITQGLFDAATTEGTFKAEFMEYAVPTYYGMMVTHFINTNFSSF